MRGQVSDSWMNYQDAQGSKYMDKTLDALFSSALARNASPGSDPSPEKFTLALLSLEILDLAKSVPQDDGWRSWRSTDGLEWLASREYVSL